MPKDGRNGSTLVVVAATAAACACTLVFHEILEHSQLQKNSVYAWQLFFNTAVLFRTVLYYTDFVLSSFSGFHVISSSDRARA